MAVRRIKDTEERASELIKWVAQTSGCDNGWSQGPVALMARNPESIRLDASGPRLPGPETFGGS
jgi:hypothetical protein